MRCGGGRWREGRDGGLRSRAGRDSRGSTMVISRACARPRAPTSVNTIVPHGVAGTILVETERARGGVGVVVLGGAGQGVGGERRGEGGPRIAAWHPLPLLVAFHLVSSSREQLLHLHVSPC